MKQILNLMLAGTLLLTACTSAPDADNTRTTDKQQVADGSGKTFTVDTAASVVGWIGTKQTGQHNGDFDVTNGELQVENGKLTAGSFEISVASLSVSDLQGEDKAKLEGHLKSPDFFQADQYPVAKFEITSVQPFDASKDQTTLPGATHLISGNLTLKDSTRNVTFPAAISVTDNTLTAAADFNIDRSNWGINYKGPNNPADWFIKKEVNLKINLKAVQEQPMQANLNDGK